MDITIVPQSNMAVMSEIAPIVIYSLAFVIALGGAWAVAVATCGGWNHVGLTQIDFWKAQVKVQCK
jgi:hypothetical protein